uniref:DUF1990 domain-containing protein n=1 Tax=Lactuca sativa TaxID=4236 RepID=A0A9R1W7R5_LACSA|nr:hypothetical protein LSAT_V11C200077390 [Lactuca sativa]
MPHWPSQSKLYHGLALLPKSRRIALASKTVILDRLGTFNYDSKYRGAIVKPLSVLEEDKELSKDGFLINHSKTLVGHFGLSWAFVDPKTPIENGVKFCACVKEFFPWLRMPLQVVYVNETRNPKLAVSSFGFGGGTLRGHLLSGEERFSVEIDEEKQVWYEILSFLKPAHPLSLLPI